MKYSIKERFYLERVSNVEGFYYITVLGALSLPLSLGCLWGIAYHKKRIRELTIAVGQLFTDLDLPSDLSEEGNTSNELLTTGEMIHQLEVGQMAEVVSNGYVGGKVYKYRDPVVGYAEIRWKESDNILAVRGYIFDTKWKLLPIDKEG